MSEEEDNPDDPARQDEVAKRLIAYAEKLKAQSENGDEPEEGSSAE